MSPRPDGHHERVTSARESWRRLLRAGRPRATKANILATLLTLALGFAIAAQLRQTSIQGLDNLREDDLVRILATVNQDGSRLTEEISKLQVARDQLLTQTGSDGALKAAQERVDALGILAGTAAAKGPGITVTVRGVNSARYGSAQLLDAVQELRDAGAEAMEINNIRIVASTYFADGADGVYVDGASIKPPYEIDAIGDSKTLGTAMSIPGGVVTTARGAGGTATVSESGQITITALHRVSEPRYARPSTEASPTK